MMLFAFMNAPCVSNWSQNFVFCRVHMERNLNHCTHSTRSYRRWFFFCESHECFIIITFQLNYVAILSSLSLSVVLLVVGQCCVWRRPFLLARPFYVCWFCLIDRCQLIVEPHNLCCFIAIAFVFVCPKGFVVISPSYFRYAVTIADKTNDHLRRAMVH